MSYTTLNRLMVNSLMTQLSNEEVNTGVAGKRSRYVASVGFDQEDSLPEGDEGQTLVIEVMLQGVRVKRMMVDYGCDNNIIYHEALAALPTGNLRYHSGGQSVYGFDDSEKRSDGVVKLSARFGTSTTGRTLTTEFLVMNKESPYNGVIDRSLSNDLQVVVSTVHVGMKLPTSSGVVKISCDMALACACCTNFEKNEWMVGQVEVEELDPEEEEKASTVEEIDRFAL